MFVHFLCLPVGLPAVYLAIDAQRQTEENHGNVSLEQRFHELEVHYSEATTLLHLQGTLILDLQVVINSLYGSLYLYAKKKNRFTDVCSQMHVVYFQSQLHNLTLLMDKVKRSPGCLANAVRPNTLMNAQEALHPGDLSASKNSHFIHSHSLFIIVTITRIIISHSGVQHVRNCPVDCASIYYNGVRRSGLYTVVPSLAAMPVEVYCDMDTDGELNLQ